MKRFLFLTVFLLITRVTSIEQDVFVKTFRDPRLTGSSTFECSLWAGAARSKVHCASICMQNHRCVSIEYDGKGNCATYCDPYVGSDVSLAKSVPYRNSRMAYTCNYIPAVYYGVNVQFTGFSYLSTMSYSCFENFIYESGNNVSVCGADGTWSLSDFYCIGPDCGIPPTLNGLTLEYSDTVYPAKAFYWCPSGDYYVSECQLDGNWFITVYGC